MPRNPRIFVGSSNEAANVDRWIRATLENLQANVVAWRDVFKAGDHPLDALLGLSYSVDGALLIVTPDDHLVSRGQDQEVPRANVLLELGIFLSQLGKHRAAIVHTQETPALLPSDLQGITTIRFETDKPGNNERRLKDFLDQVSADVSAHPALAELQVMLRDTIAKVPPAWHADLDHYLLQGIGEVLHLAARGQVILSPGQYYDAIYSEMEKASDGTDILAVATLSSSFWSEDRDQQYYLRRNHEAVRRGARIRRLFVVPDPQWDDLTPILRMQLLAGIQVRRAIQRIATEVLALEDMVMFRDVVSGESRVFIADPAFDNNRRIRRARLLVDPGERQQLVKLFEQAWAAAPTVGLSDLDEPRGGDDSDIEPAIGMKSYGLAQPVVSCEEAAAAKCIPLENELKTLVLVTSRGFVALNLPGDSVADFRAVKSALEADEACLASPDQLTALGMSPGTVCAIKRPVWGMPFLLSRRVLQFSFVSTNDGTLRGFYKFDPAVLLRARSVMLGDFERRAF